MKTVKVRELTPAEIEFTKGFQELISIMHDAFHNNDTKLKSLKDFQKFKEITKRFHNLPYSNLLRNMISDIETETTSIIKNKSQIPVLTSSLQPAIHELYQAFTKLDFNKMNTLGKKLKSINDNIMNGSLNVNELVQNTGNPYKIGNPMFFQTTDFIRKFEPDDMQEVINKNLKEYKYTYLTLPDTKSHDFQYIVHFINELKNTDKNVELEGNLFTKYTKFIYDNEKFIELHKMVGEYLSSNTKKLIPHILEKMKEFPEIIEANETAKNNIKIVYRGIPDVDIDDAKNEEIKRKYVATSKSILVAKRFAYKIGHLESLENRRSEEGVIITYNVTPDSILFDTSVFGGIFNENEILIDTTKSSIKDIESV